MGVVYLAFDRFERREVALKRLLTAHDGFESETRAAEMESIGHEFRVMAGLRHPNIVSVYDFGFDEAGQPFFTMEPLTSPRALLEAIAGRPQIHQLQALLEVLGALAYLHRHQVLHRDLKPSNILVADNRVRLLDFGISELANTTTLSRFGSARTAFAGTMAYLAPEIFLGQQASTATDLWAVGILLFEILAGVHPLGPAPLKTIHQLLAGQPIPLDHPGVQAALPLLGSLLAIDPGQRLNDAEAAAQALRETFGISSSPDLDQLCDVYLQHAPLVGRKAEMARATQLLDAADKGTGGLWWLVGESGVGKSRLIEEIRIRAQVRGFVVVGGRGNANGGPAYGIWRRPILLAALLAELNDDDAAILQTIVPDLASLLDRALEPRPDAHLPGHQTRLFETVAALLKRVRLPLLVVLDDLQWSDQPSRQLLGYLVAPLCESRVLLLASSRSEDLSCFSSDTMTRLARLQGEQIAMFARSILGVPPTPYLVDVLRAETEGNPFFMVELLRLLAFEAGGLDKILDHFDRRVGTPLRIREALDQRLSLVPEAARELLGIAALAGRRLDLFLLAAVAGREIQLDLWLREVAPVIEADGAGWQFGHDRLREALIERQSPSARRSRHAMIADRLEELEPSNERCAALAFHREAAVSPGDPATVLPAVKAIERHASLLLSDAIPESRAFFVRAIELLNQLPPSRELCAWEAHLQLALASSGTASIGDAETTIPFRRALQLGRQLDDRRIQAAAYLGLWRRDFWLADISRCEQLADEFVAWAEADGHVASVIFAHYTRASCRFAIGMPQTHRLFDRIYELDQSADEEDRQEVRRAPGLNVIMVSQFYSAWALNKAGRGHDSLERIRRAADLVRDGRQVANRYFHWVALFMTHQGRRDPAAISTLWRQVTQDRLPPIDYYLNALQAIRCWALILAGCRDSDTIENLRRSSRWLSRSGIGGDHLFYLSIAAECETLLGRPDNAEYCLAEAEAITAKNGKRHMLPELCRLRGLNALQRGDKARGVSLLGRALDLAAAQPWATVGFLAARALFELDPCSSSYELLVARHALLDDSFDVPELLLVP